MKSRVAFVVGCDEYEHLNQLSGACKDARGMYEVLVAAKLGGYDQSVLLLSPTLDQFRTALNEALFDPQDIDVFTLFFAGHGGVKSGSYYLCFRDTRFDRMSATAHPLNALFTCLNERSPGQVNIIIDACSAGGLVSDLGTLLKPEVLGSKGSSSISLLAAASADEYAAETNDGGVVTNLVVSYLSGVKKLNSSSPFLDLSDIGKAISTEVDKHHEQTPTTWALNLYGQSRFAHNPHFAQTPSALPAGLFDIVPTSQVGQIISEHADAIWSEYRATGDDPEPFRLAAVLRRLTAKIAHDPEAVASFINGIAPGFEQQADTSRDEFGAVNVVSVLLAILLEFLESAAAQISAKRLLERRRELVLRGIAAVNRGLDDDNYYLLGKGEILAELFLLPIRLCKLLGNIWAQVVLDKIMLVQDMTATACAITLTERIFSIYATSFVAVSDEQAPYLYMIAQGARAVGAEKTVAPVCEAIFSDVVQRKGSFARSSMEAEHILRFLLHRFHGQEQTAFELLANPSQLVAVLLSLRAGSINEQNVDRRLRALDHHSLVIFIPNSTQQFGTEIIRDGVNNVFKVGHGVWTTQDFRREFTAECVPTLDKDASWRDSLVQALAIVAALAFPDRLPWFLERVTYGENTPATPHA